MNKDNIRYFENNMVRKEHLAEDLKRIPLNHDEAELFDQLLKRVCISGGISDSMINRPRGLVTHLCNLIDFAYQGGVDIYKSTEEIRAKKRANASKMHNSEGVRK